MSSPSPTMPVMINSRGNQCALLEGFSPCFMEVEERKQPNWEQCQLNEIKGAEYLGKMVEWRVQVFPDPPSGSDPELQSGNGNSITFQEWMERVMRPCLEVSK